MNFFISNNIYCAMYKTLSFKEYHCKKLKNNIRKVKIFHQCRCHTSRRYLLGNYALTIVFPTKNKFDRFR